MAGYKGMPRFRRARSRKPGFRGTTCPDCRKFLPNARELDYCTTCFNQRKLLMERRSEERDPRWLGPEAAALLREMNWG